VFPEQRESLQKGYTKSEARTVFFVRSVPSGISVVNLNTRNPQKTQSAQRELTFDTTALSYDLAALCCGETSNGTTTLKLIFLPILNIPGLTPGGTVGLSKYFNLLMLD